MVTLKIQGLSDSEETLVFSLGSFPKWLDGLSQWEFTVLVTALSDTALALQLTTVPSFQDPQSYLHLSLSGRQYPEPCFHTAFTNKMLPLHPTCTIRPASALKNATTNSDGIMRHGDSPRQWV